MTAEVTDCLEAIQEALLSLSVRLSTRDYRHLISALADNLDAQLADEDE